MSFAPSQVSTRFLALLRQLVSEHGSASAVARELGLSPSYVAKLLRGEGGGNVREQTVRDVLERLKLRPETLERDDFDPAAWRDHARPIGVKVFTTLSRLIARAEELDALYRAGTPPPADEVRKLAEHFIAFLGGTPISLAKKIEDTPVQAAAVALGEFFVRALRDYKLPKPD